MYAVALDLRVFANSVSIAAWAKIIDAEGMEEIGMDSVTNGDALGLA